ncbi:MAG: phosphopantothenoylcysteine decarboxylase [Kiritimatiellaeota bacterium]|nr:phosphopantothenoylcysteine decarboxylase [Kiritimatiellota bacterium]
MTLLITAGPTREFIDPVRYISNRSSGKMGCAVAESGLRHGHKVILVAGPLSIAPPAGAEVINVVSALEMLAAVEANLERCDALVAAAAVADYRPEKYIPSKIKKTFGLQPSTLNLVQNPDILATIAPRKGGRVFVGFAAETENLLENAAEKLARKNLDMIVANDITKPGAGFDTDTNEVVLITRSGPSPVPLQSKSAIADLIIAKITELIRQQSAP